MTARDTKGTKGKKNTYLGEGVQNVPVAVIFVKDGYVGSRACSGKPFTDNGGDVFIARRSVRTSNEQVVLARRDLMDRQTCESAERKIRKRKGFSHSPCG